MRKKFLFLITGILTLSLASLALSTPASACLDANGNPVDRTNDEAVDCLSSEESTKTADTSGTTTLISPNLATSESSDKTHENYFVTSDSDDAKVDSSLDVDNSVFLAGNEVSYSGRAKGLAFLAGSTAELLGQADYGLIAGQSVKISGIVDHDLFAAGQAVEIKEDAQISRDVFLAGQTVKISANLYGNVFIAAERVEFDSVTISGDVYVAASDIVFSGRTAISGTLHTSSSLTGKENLSVSNIETFDSFVASTEEESEAKSEAKSAPILLKIFLKFFSYLSRALVSVILILLFAPLARRLAAFNISAVPKSLGIGLLLILGVPICAAFVMLLMAGLPLGLIALLVYGIVMYLATSVTSLALGSKLYGLITKQPYACAETATQSAKSAKTEKSSLTPLYLSFLLGCLIIYALELVPVIGHAIACLSTIFGFGYLYLAIFTLRREK